MLSWLVRDCLPIPLFREQLSHNANLTCPPEIDPECIFGFRFGSS